MPTRALSNIADDTIEAAAIEAGSPLEWYWKFSQSQDFESDPSQLAVLQHLERLHTEIESYRQYRQGKLNRLVTNFGGGKRPPQGIYIWGSVGRGKSLMMDAFYNVSTIKRKRRVHFHAFMQELHHELQTHTGEEDPLDSISTNIAKQLRLLCFDEFHVSDIADAMILGRLITLLISKGVVLVMTSNYPPDDLYPNGLQRAQFLPAIAIIKHELEVVEIGGDRDHRQRILALIPVYHLATDQQTEANAELALSRAFSAMSKAGVNVDGVMKIGHRDLPYVRRAKGVVWFEFGSLCVEPRSQMDYLEIASQYHTVLVSHIPQLHAKNRADVVRRLTWLVDIFYDKRVKLICSAAAEPEWLVVDDRNEWQARSQASIASNNNGDASLMVAAEFGRTASRLREMQTRDYFSRKHASADNPQVMLKR